MSKGKEKKHPPSEYISYKDYMKDLADPPYPDWKPQSYEWLEEKAVDKTFWTYPPCPWERRVVDMSEGCKYEVEAKVLEIRGTGVCPYGHKPGDAFIFEGDGL